MPEYLSPGVYVEEIDTGSKPIEGVSTSTTGMIGVTERGPGHVPILITGMAEFRRWFGDLLPEAEFQNVNPATNEVEYHCYLPNAVDGFFTNGGKRAYVTRIVRDDAVHAARMLFDRGSPGFVESVLLRPAGMGTGTAVNPPLLSVLAPAGLNVNEWIRIGDGSQTEYRQVAVLSANATHVPLSFPLQLAHAAGTTIENRQRQNDPGFPGGLFTLSVAAQAGDDALTLAGPAADLAALAAGRLLEIRSLALGNRGEFAEYHFIQTVGPVVAGTRIVTLDHPLTDSYPIAARVQAVNPAAPLVVGSAATTLTTAANLGDVVAFGQNLGGDFDQRDTLVFIDPANAAEHEVRRVGSLQTIGLRRPAYDAYPAGTTLWQVTATTDNRQITAATAVGAQTVPVNNVTNLAQGLTVIVDPTGANPETRVLQAVDATASTVRFNQALAFVHVINTVLAPQWTLTAAATAGSLAISLDTRAGLNQNDVLEVDTGAGRELIEIASMGTGTGAGAVILAGPLGQDHANGTVVRRVLVADMAGDHRLGFPVLDAARGAATLVVNDNEGYIAGSLLRVTTPSGQVFYHDLSVAAIAANPRDVEVAGLPLRWNHEAGSPLMQRSPLFNVEALDAGSWGDRLRISVTDETRGLVSAARVAGLINPTTVVLSSITGVEPGTVLELYGPGDQGPVLGPLLKVDSANRTNSQVTLSANLDPVTQLPQVIAAIAANDPLRVRSREFRLEVRVLRRPDPAVPSRNDSVQSLERFEFLSMDPRHSRYFERVIGRIWQPGDPLRLSDRRPEGDSWYIRVLDQGAPATQVGVRLGPEALTDPQPSGPPRPARHPLFGGTDGLLLLNDADYVGLDAADPEARTGLFTLKNIEEVSLVACPGRTGATLQQALIDHCEELRYRFAVLDAPRPNSDTLADIRAHRQQFDSKYAALYHPWLLIDHPFPGVAGTAPPLYPIPPAGHVLGIYARTDIERGVHKAPANEVVRGIRDLQRKLVKGEQDVLNAYPVNINVIRDFRTNNRGIRVWGGRVITSDSDWKYVNVRRLLIFLEHSIDRGLQWVVFEPNAEPLWARVRRVISNFLTVVWRNGALEGTKVEEAFFVKCDRTTMSQTDIDSGRLICVIGVAPVKPAEFVIIRIGLWTAHADT